VAAKIQANFHTGVAAANDQDPLVIVIRTRFVDAGVNNGTVKHVHARNGGNNRLSILSGSNDEPRGNVLKTVGSDEPKLRRRVELGGLNGLVEPGADVEARSVGVEVGDELVLGGVFWEMEGEGHQGEFAEVFGEVEFETVVGSVLPEGGDAVAPLENDVGHSMVGEARGHG